MMKSEIAGPRLAMQALMSLHDALFSAIETGEITDFGEVDRITRFARERVSRFALDWTHYGSENVYSEVRRFVADATEIMVIDSLGEGYLLVGGRAVYPDLPTMFLGLGWVGNDLEGEVETIYFDLGAPISLNARRWDAAVAAFVEEERKRILDLYP